ncbi:MAG: ABC transporter permease [Martelella sp.]|uniref:ABC transporter permease n=1 Tax=unclassified Martelella TaxID=2629616 RepID=UPI000C62C2CC|nr:ABC transporter permease [Martelella sp.]MAU19344.1 ABC transporter permease [Martelella sp.]|tara:strand:- start:638 stop:1576 length:939 start_codon:yes stop_codon:yes gene_type:complete
MTLFALAGAFETGLLFALVALSIFMSFRVLDFPDLTVDGSFPLGAAVSAAAIIQGIDPFIATFFGLMAGAAAGFVTGLLNVRFGIMNLLAGILSMVALFSINLRIMGRPNLPVYGQDTVFSRFEDLVGAGLWSNTILLLIIAIGAKFIIDWFLKTEIGLGLRASGENPAMAEAQGIRNGAMTLLGMSIANALCALAGSLFAQMQGVADVTMGVGTIVTGLAALIIGEAILGRRTVFLATLGCVIGAVVYRLFIAFALSAGFIGIKPQDLNLITAIVVAVAVVLSQSRGKKGRKSMFNFRLVRGAQQSDEGQD